MWRSALWMSISGAYAKPWNHIIARHTYRPSAVAVIAVHPYWSTDGTGLAPESAGLCLPAPAGTDALRSLRIRVAGVVLRDFHISDLASREPLSPGTLVAQRAAVQHSGIIRSLGGG